MKELVNGTSLMDNPRVLRKDILLIINPNASKGKGRSKAKEIKALFQERGRECTVAYTKETGHAESLAYRGASYGYGVIVAAGGDGTVNEVASGIMRSGKNIPLGIIPIGRGNDFAWIAGIPQKTKDAVSLIVDGIVSRIDVGFCKGPEHPKGMYFLNGAGFGFEPMVNFRAMGYKRINGMPSYVAAFFYILRHVPKPYNIRMKIDGEERLLSTQQISICNGRRMGSAFIMAPKAEIDDGLFDVMFTNHPLSGRELIKAVIAFFRGSQVSDTNLFTYMNATKVEIASEEPVVQAHCDGEVFTKNGTLFSISLLPGALGLVRGKIS
ncbi:MAG: diacylglycerol kinase family lipid kinase [Spirochaetes bacterium]|uniref:Diacylglycerol kinase family lipid kinase n=1 Tax=Candidatus Ornithospirochaeta stercoravium TaxID=2840897 RepID=A0A9D9IEC6_9SPIO|nr:diacylglycerol kinase family lipid kinase [Candidatus Ornithospirochaeta stercoravium]